MFYLKDPRTLGKPWMLSHPNEDVVCVSEEVTKDLRRHHIMGVNFLYQNYRRKFKGAILNEEGGMNMGIQVCAFLNAVYKTNENLLNIVICPDSSIRLWKYHLAVHGKLQFKTIDSIDCLENLDTESGLTLILCFSNIKLIEELAEYDYFSVIIDDHDYIATKIILRKLTGLFHIGLTKRNFYTNPDQKLQWTMLNWSNPGCVGKLANFYSIDNDNIANYRDNYKHWWFRLTWKFCESFEQTTESELAEYNKTVKTWRFEEPELPPPVKKPVQIVTQAAKPVKEIKTKKMGIIFKNSINKNFDVGKFIPKGVVSGNVRENQRQVEEIKKAQNAKEKSPKQSPKKHQYIDCSKKNVSPPTPKKGKRKALPVDWDRSFEKEPSPEVVPLKDFFRHSFSANKRQKTNDEAETSNYVKLPSMDENPIIDSIKMIFEKSPGPVKQPFQFYDKPSCSTKSNNDNTEDEMTIKDKTGITMEDETEMPVEEETESCKEVEIPVDNGAADFFKSLISPTKNRGESEETIILSPIKKSENISMDDEIEKLLRETDKILEST